MKRTHFRTTAGVVAVLALAAATPAAADSVADFYAGKQITINVGYGAGGGYDTTTRLVGRHFGKHVPGNPTVVVQNMPGAGSLKAANFTYNAAPKDGTVLGVFAAATALEPLFGNRNAKFETNKFAWIGSFDRDVNGCAVWKGAERGIKTLADVRAVKKQLVFGGSSPAATSGQHPAYLKNALGLNIKIITGYKGSKGFMQAMRRGEVDAACGLNVSSVRASYMQDVDNGNLTFFIQFGEKPVPLFGGATVLYDVLKTEEEKAIARVIFGQSEIARPLAAPPGTPAERVAALRKALMETIGDPAFKKDAARLGLDMTPISGEETVKLFARFLATPPDLVKKAAAAIKVQ